METFTELYTEISKLTFGQDLAALELIAINKYPRSKGRITLLKLKDLIEVMPEIRKAYECPN